jgi:hypothetical protein
MGIFSNLFGSPKPKKTAAIPSTPTEINSVTLNDNWPNNLSWGALRSGVSVETSDGPRHLKTVDCGDLFIPSGRLVVCDPFVFLSPTDTPFILVPKGRFPVRVTIADVSETQNGTHLREAYASVIFSDEEAFERRAIALAKDGEDRPMLVGDDFIGFGVDAGTACFVDETVVKSCMPDSSTWYEDLFENDSDDCWFRRMDDPNHIRAGIANIVLPLGINGENLVLFHSGWGDGVYPVIGSYGRDGGLVAVHIDFMVVR